VNPGVSEPHASFSAHPRSEPGLRTPLQESEPGLRTPLQKTVVALGGEGIGIEVVDATCELLTAAGFPLKILTPAHGESAQRAHGSPLPDETKRLCGEADGVLFGAAGSPASSAVVSYLRWQQDAYAGVRPIKYYRGAASPLANPDGIDFMGLDAEASRLEAAVARVYADGKHLTRDQGGTATTKELCRAVLDALR
jgi:isocitrate/isopropylmalate dehydrogenase